MWEVKLTEKQKNALLILNEEKSLEDPNSKVHGNTLRSLYPNFISIRLYSKGNSHAWYWEMKDTGIALVKDILKGKKKFYWNSHTLPS